MTHLPLPRRHTTFRRISMSAAPAPMRRRNRNRNTRTMRTSRRSPRTRRCISRNTARPTRPRTNTRTTPRRRRTMPRLRRHLGRSQSSTLQNTTSRSPNRSRPSRPRSGRPMSLTASTRLTPPVRTARMTTGTPRASWTTIWATIMPKRSTMNVRSRSSGRRRTSSRQASRNTYSPS